MLVRRSWIALACAALLVASVASPTFAYGKENWQTTFAGTAVTPGGVSFGFWGWCAFGGGVTSGNTGDCQLAQYLHGVSGQSFTCHESLDITSWSIASGQFVASGTVTVTPSTQTAACVAFFPGSNPFVGVPLGIPGAPGHYNLTSGFLGPNQVGELQIQVTQIP